MDINCTSNCIHQEEGKCCYTVLSEPDVALYQSNAKDNGNDADCPYFRGKPNGGHGQNSASLPVFSSNGISV